MVGITQTCFADLASVSQPAIAKALRLGRLERDRDGGIDPNHPTNAKWLAVHARGHDRLGRPLRRLAEGVREKSTARAAGAR
jgi:hypothetical protein